MTELGFLVQAYFSPLERADIFSPILLWCKQKNVRGATVSGYAFCVLLRQQCFIIK